MQSSPALEPDSHREGGVRYAWGYGLGAAVTAIATTIALGGAGLLGLSLLSLGKAEPIAMLLVAALTLAIIGATCRAVWLLAREARRSRQYSRASSAPLSWDGEGLRWVDQPLMRWEDIHNVKVRSFSTRGVHIEWLALEVADTSGKRTMRSIGCPYYLDTPFRAVQWARFILRRSARARQAVGPNHA